MFEYKNCLYENSSFSTCVGFVEGAGKATLHENTIILNSEGKNTENLKEITFNKNLEYISNSALHKIAAKNIDLSHTNLKSIGIASFSSSKIEDIKLPTSLENIGNDAFARCASLKSIDLSNTKVSRIQSCTFSSCIALKNVKLNDNIRYLGASVFDSCIKLEEIDLSNTKIEEIAQSTFKDCRSLTKVLLPDDIHTMWKSAFYLCTSLKDITLPESMQEIQSCVFAESGVKHLHLPKNFKYIDESNLEWIKKITYISLDKTVEAKLKDMCKENETKLAKLSIDNLLDKGISFKKANSIIKDLER